MLLCYCTMMAIEPRFIGAVCFLSIGGLLRVRPDLPSTGATAWQATSGTQHTLNLRSYCEIFPTRPCAGDYSPMAIHVATAS
jgi:hypothetical protein